MTQTFPLLSSIKLEGLISRCNMPWRLRVIQRLGDLQTDPGDASEAVDIVTIGARPATRTGCGRAVRRHILLVGDGE